MAEAVKPLAESPTWKALAAHFQKIERLHLRELFGADAGRGERLAIRRLPESTSTIPRTASPMKQ